MVRMPPETDPAGPSGERTVEHILGQLRADLRLSEPRAHFAATEISNIKILEAKRQTNVARFNRDIRRSASEIPAKPSIGPGGFASRKVYIIYVIGT